MGVCDKIWSGLDMECAPIIRKNYQRVVLVNRSDVRNKSISTSYVNIGGEFVCRHRIMFDLHEGKTGYLYSLGENSASIFGSAEKTDKEGIPQYLHTVTLPITGIDEASKCVLSQLDKADYFAAILYYDGTVEIYGFEYGLSTGSYTYDPINSGGGAITKLQSDGDSLEDDLPLLYVSQNATPTEDFDNLFAQHEITIGGDFNDDFNNDLNNQE